jgi:CheY-like chemotaxis protein
VTPPREQSSRWDRSSSPKTLLVEDNIAIRMLLRELLKAEGVSRFAEAQNGLEVLQKLRERRFDVILADLEMPEMDGLDLLRQIRSGAAPINRSPPVVMVTAHASRDVVENVRALGVLDFIVKPVTAGQVHSKLKSALARPSTPPPGVPSEPDDDAWEI